MVHYSNNNTKGLKRIKEGQHSNLYVKKQLLAVGINDKINTGRFWLGSLHHSFQNCHISLN
jgi:hypothetical protein